jgi:hypothetical protein
MFIMVLYGKGDFISVDIIWFLDDFLIIGEE